MSTSDGTPGGSDAQIRASSVRPGPGRIPIVGVMGSGVEAHAEFAIPLGRRLARLGVHLLTGGGAGVMEAVSRAFAQEPGRAGLVIGIHPLDHCFSRTDALYEDGRGVEGRGYANRWVELPIRTHLGRDGDDPLSRNHLNILTSDVVVALPGGAGTDSEIRLALRYERPLILYGDPERAQGLPNRVAVAENTDQAINFVARELAAGLRK